MPSSAWKKNYVDNCKISHTVRLLRVTDELLRQRSFEWEPKTNALQHSLNGSWLFLKFFFNDWATTEIYPLSLHDALPICCLPGTDRRAPHGHPGRRPVATTGGRHG